MYIRLLHCVSKDKLPSAINGHRGDAATKSDSQSNR